MKRKGYFVVVCMLFVVVVVGTSCSLFTGQTKEVTKEEVQQSSNVEEKKESTESTTGRDSTKESVAETTKAIISEWTELDESQRNGYHFMIAELLSIKGDVLYTAEFDGIEDVIYEITKEDMPTLLNSFVRREYYKEDGFYTEEDKRVKTVVMDGETFELPTVDLDKNVELVENIYGLTMPDDYIEAMSSSFLTVEGNDLSFVPADGEGYVEVVTDGYFMEKGKLHTFGTVRSEYSEEFFAYEAVFKENSKSPYDYSLERVDIHNPNY